MSLFPAILSFKKLRRTSQVSPPKSQQCGQSATHDWMFSLSPAMVLAAMAIRNIQLNVSTHISHERAHHFAENRLQIGE